MNPAIGDKGACQLAEALREDIWIKGLLPVCVSLCVLDDSCILWRACVRS